MKKISKRSLALLFIITQSSVHTSLLAQENTVGPIIITATRTTQTADESLAAVTIITRKDIEEIQPNSILDLLQSQSGIHISRNGGIGKNTSVYLRGANSNQTLVLIDGVRAASATLGTFAWSTLSPEQIEKIEIVRGPRASLYGSDAIGGVIHIFTRKNRKTFVQVKAGSQNTRELSIGTGAGEKLQYSINFNRIITDGIPTHEVFTQNHGYANSNVTLKVGGDINNQLNANVSLSQAETYNINDPDTGDSESTNRIISVNLEYQASDAWLQSLRFGNTLDRSQSFSPTIPSTITTKRNSLTWQNDIDVTVGLLSLGVDLWKDHATKDNNGLINKRIDNKGFFAQYQTTLNGNDLLAGIREDDHSSFGKESTWNVAWGRDVGKTRLTASYGTAFKAPSINDLFWPRSTSAFFGTTYITEGNPDIKPEKSKSFEVGLTFKPSGNSNISVNLYKTRITKLIDWVSTQTGVAEFTFRPTNINNANIEGMELSADYTYAKWKINANINMLNAIDAGTKKQLDRRPRRNLSLLLSRKLTKGAIKTEIVAASTRNDRSGIAQIPGYAIINAMYERDITRKLKLSLRLDNITNHKYTLVRSFSGDYNTYGSSGYLGLKYTFN